MIRFLLLMSRQGKVRLAKWYQNYSKKEQAAIIREVSNKLLKRRSRQCNFIEWRDGKLVYKRYASLSFICFVDNDDNELIHLETIHHFVEILDSYFGNVCELDLIFNFHRSYFLLDEVLLAGELQETSKRQILKAAGTMDAMMSPQYDQDPKKHAELIQQSLRKSDLW